MVARGLGVKNNNIPRGKISCNFLVQGIRRVLQRVPGIGSKLDRLLSILDTRIYSRWVAKKIPPCDAYIGLSGTGLHAGKKVQALGSGYVMDRGSTHIRYADSILSAEHEAWSIPYRSVHKWLIENEEAEAELADLIMVPSDFAAETFVQQGVPREKLRVVPYGINLAEFYPNGTPPRDRFRLVFVGQFSLRKGAPYLLEAFRQFQHPRKELVVVGNIGEDMKILLTVNPPSDVRFEGWYPREKVKDYLSTAHALVLPSIEEGLALVQAQAMACGCPVIATPNTGSETLFTHRREGLIVDARDPIALMEAFVELADNPALRDQLAANALERARAIGGWESYADMVVDVCRQAQAIAQARQARSKAHPEGRG